MADADALQHVGERLVDVLRTGLDPLLNEQEEVALASPADADTNARVTLYLYDVSPNAHAQNEPVGVRRGDPPTQPDHPLRLELRYLLTAYPSTGRGNDGGAAEHRMLGNAMQVLHDEPVLDGAGLPEGFGEDEALGVSLLPDGRDDALSLWGTFEDVPYRPSVAYLVTPVEVEATGERPVDRVTTREFVEHVPEGESDG